MKYLIFLLPFLFSNTWAGNQNIKKPKLVVGIVVDQMRYDYLYKYWDKYQEGGFKRLLNKGYSFENTHYNYTPTYTGPGHAAIYSGTSPHVNGIVGNNWFDRNEKRVVYVTEDNSVQSVGGSEKAGQMSPKYLMSTTITDELEMNTQKRAKVVGIALKDRGAILPAGHAADAAYWFDGKTGNFISSSFYVNDLPQWVKNFNDKKLPDSYLNQTWNTLLPIEKYTESTADDVSWEILFKGKEKPTFPYNLAELRKNTDFGLVSKTPFGSTLTLEFALAALENENMGKDAICDFLALSFSSPDYIGHQFGPDAIEVQDNYLRLDLELKRLFDYLDKNVGKNDYLVFLTADHGGMNTIGYLKDHKIKSGNFEQKRFENELNIVLNKEFGEEKWIESMENQQIYLNHELIKAKNIDVEKMSKSIIKFSQHFDGVYRVLTSEEIMNNHFETPIVKRVQNGFYNKRSGDISLILNPGWFDGGENHKGGTTHGSGFAYDTHIPLVFMGAGIKPGKNIEYSEIIDIAPTIAHILKIMEPSGNTGKILEFE